MNCKQNWVYGEELIWFIKSIMIFNNSSGKSYDQRPCFRGKKLKTFEIEQSKNELNIKLI